MTELLRLGPLHTEIPAVFQVDLDLDGGFIEAARVKVGFGSKGVERLFETKAWERLIPLASRIDSENSVFGEMVLSLALETLGSIDVPHRGQLVRIVLCELSRIAAHLKNISEVALRAGAEAVHHFTLRDRERILDLFELLSGGRFNLNILRVGGTANDLTEGFIERSMDVCKLVRARIKEYNDLLTFNSHFLRRARGVGVISKENALSFGLTGPSARASGVAFDARKDTPYSGYDHIDFVPVSSERGDVHDRTVLRLREIEASTHMIGQCLESISGGPTWSSKGQGKLVINKGEAYARVESPRGLLGCFAVSSGQHTPDRIQIRAPSHAGFLGAQAALKQAREEDIGLILASLDLSSSEVDR